MKKLIVISAALASVTLLSGCKTVVVHRAYVPPVVVDSRHHHEPDVVVIDRHDPRYRHIDRRDIPPEYRDRVVVKKKVIVVKPQPDKRRFERHVEQRQPAHDNRRPNPPGHTREKVVVHKQVVVEKPRRFEQRAVEQHRSEKRVEVRREVQHRQEAPRHDNRRNQRDDDRRDNGKKRDNRADNRDKRFR